MTVSTQDRARELKSAFIVGSQFDHFGLPCLDFLVDVPPLYLESIVPILRSDDQLDALTSRYGDCLGAEFESARRDLDLALVRLIVDRCGNAHCGRQQNYQRQSDSDEAVSPCFHLCEAPREDWRAPERLESAAEPSINCRSIVFHRLSYLSAEDFS